MTIIPETKVVFEKDKGFIEFNGKRIDFEIEVDEIGIFIDFGKNDVMLGDFIRRSIRNSIKEKEENFEDITTDDIPKTEIIIPELEIREITTVWGKAEMSEDLFRTTIFMVRWGKDKDNINFFEITTGDGYELNWIDSVDGDIMPDGIEDIVWHMNKYI